MRNQKGVTLTILVATVIVLSLILGTIAFNSTSSLKLNTYYNMYSDIELLDEKIAYYYLENNDIPKTGESISITRIVNDYNENNVNYNPNNSGDLYKINLSLLDNLSLNYTDYYIDSQSHTIYFAKGIVLDNVKYNTIPIDYQLVNLNLYQD